MSPAREGRSGGDREESREHRTEQQGKGREKEDQGMHGIKHPRSKACLRGRARGEGEVKRGKAEEQILTR